MKKNSYKKYMSRSTVKILFLILAVSIILPFIGAQTYVGEGVVDSQVVYREGLFGPVHKMVTDENGIRMHVIDYPWYYFKDLPSMNIYGIVGSSSSNDISFVLEKGTAYKEITFKQQHDLYFPDSVWEKYPDATKAELVMYNGLPSDSQMYFAFPDPYKTKATVKGPFSYGQTWATTLTFYNSWELKEGNTYDYTVQETIYIDGPITDVGYDTDRAFVHVTIPKPGATTATLTVTVLDNLKALPCSIRLYKDGQVYQNSVYLSGGTKTFTDLPFGTYSVQVLANDYDTFFYDAYPAQSGYSYDLGRVQLSSTVNTCNYIVYGITDATREDGSSGLDSGNTVPTIPNASEIIDNLLGGGDGENTSLLDLIRTLIGSLGLLAVVALGLPLFMVILFLFLAIAWVAGGDKKHGKK